MYTKNYLGFESVEVKDKSNSMYINNDGDPTLNDEEIFQEVERERTEED